MAGVTFVSSNVLQQLFDLITSWENSDEEKRMHKEKGTDWLNLVLSKWQPLNSVREFMAVINPYMTR